MRRTKQEFIDLLTPTEMVNILSASKESPEVEAWIFRFNNLTADSDGTSIDLTDARTVGGLHLMEQAGLIGPGRAIEILNTQPLNAIEPTPEETIPEGVLRVYKIGSSFMTLSAGEVDPETFDDRWEVPAYLTSCIYEGARMVEVDGKLEITLRF